VSSLSIVDDVKSALAPRANVWWSLINAKAEGHKTMEDRENQARRTVKRYMWFSAGVGLLRLPFLNVAGITALQLRMLQVLSEYYDVPFSRDLGKKIIGSLLGSIVPTSLSGILGGTVGLFASSVKAATVGRSIIGGLSLPVFAGASTYAIGKVFIQHFESGGTFLDFEPAKVRAYFSQQFDKGRDFASEARSDSGQGEHTSAAEI
jgi:uncharacterized protein (DUF697 family)